MPTRAEYIKYGLSLVGSYAGHGENNNKFNTWYYGKKVEGSNWAWCDVFECYWMDHFGILEANGGKSAYVPNMPDVAKRVGAQVWKNPRRGSKAYQPGNRVGFDFNKSGEAEHTGTFYKERDSRTFWSIDGNTGNDEVAKRVRYYSDVLFVVELLGVDTETPTEKGDEVPDYVSLSTKEPVSLKMGESVFVKFDVENSDTGKRHDPDTSAIFVAGKNGSIYEASVYFNGPATWELCEMRKEGSDWKQHDHAIDGGPDLLDSGNHLWLKLHPTGDGTGTPTVKCVVWDR